MDLRMKRLALASLLLTAPHAASAEQLAAGSSRAYMPPAQILQCLRDKREVDTLNFDMAQEKAALDATAAALQQEQFALEQAGKEMVARIYQENQKANRTAPPINDNGDPRLDHYLRQYAGANGMRRKHNKAVAASQQKLHAHNAKIDNYNLRLAGLRQRGQIVDRACTGVPVKPDDLTAARAVLEAESLRPNPPPPIPAR